MQKLSLLFFFLFHYEINFPSCIEENLLYQVRVLKQVK